MAKYSRRKDGRYVANRIIDGKRKVFYGKTCKEIDEKIRAYLTEGEQGRSFKEIAEEWYSDLQQTGSYSAVSTFKKPYERLVAELGPKPIKKVGPLDVQRFVAAFARKGYARNTVATQLTVARLIFKHAVLAGDLDVSPAVSIQLPDNLPETKRPALTEDQEARVLAFRDGSDEALFGHILLLTGMRRGELLALQWQDIDRGAGVIHVTKKVNYSASAAGVIEHHLKSKNGTRDIPLWPELEELLPHGRIGLVFSQDGTHLSRSGVECFWKRYCRAAGLADDQGRPLCTPHQFRHTFATLAYEAGADTFTCASWMGDNPQVVESVYQELRPTMQQASREKMGEHLRQKVSALG